jgi:hypothetical protein
MSRGNNREAKVGDFLALELREQLLLKESNPDGLSANTVIFEQTTNVIISGLSHDSVYVKMSFHPTLLISNPFFVKLIGLEVDKRKDLALLFIEIHDYIRKSTLVRSITYE